MKLNIAPEDVWAAAIQDQPGALAEKLEALAEAGADLRFVIARRSPEKPGTGVIFVTSLAADQQSAAQEVGFAKTSSLHSVCITTPDEPGLCAKLTRHLAQAGINLRGLSAAALGPQAVLHLAFDSDDDTQQAIKELKTL